MKLPLQVKGIEVFYDGRCGMCCTFHEWVARQERAYPVVFVPYQDERAERIFPGLGVLDPAREMVVRTAGGGIYRGAEAWVLCLYSCVAYRELAGRLASRRLLPLAKRACAVLAANRHGLSKIFFRRKDLEVRARLHAIPDPCEEGDREIVVMSDEGDIWQGPEAWVVSLWVLRKWRRWTERMASPVLLPLASRIFHLISARRMTFSRLLALKADEEVRAECERSAAGCADDGCLVMQGRRGHD